jgi:hypothetical protein
MRAILQCPYRTHRVDMLRELDWLSIHHHIVFKSIMFIWDVFHGDNEELKKFLRQNSDVHSYNTRSLHDFHMPMQINNTSGQKSLFVSGLKFYNNIPGYTKREDMSRNVFKKGVIQYIKDNVPSLLPSSN